MRFKEFKTKNKPKNQAKSSKQFQQEVDRVKQVFQDQSKAK